MSDERRRYLSLMDSLRCGGKIINCENIMCDFRVPINMCRDCICDVDRLKERAANVIDTQREAIMELEERAEKERWHDLRMNPEDLPELIPTSVGTAYSETVVVWTSDRKIVAAVYSHEGEFVGDGIFWEVEGNVIAWRYIMPPEEAEHETD